MIYKTTHNFFVYHFFQLYSLWRTKWNFSKTFINGTFNDRGLPVLVLSNHFSWWDGFWVVCLNYRVFGRRFHFMMLEEQLKKHMFFTKTGGFSIKKGSRSVIETLDYTAEILSDKRNLVLLFPQGEIRSMHTTDFEFETGIEHIIVRLKSNIHIVFLANILDYFSGSKPCLYMYFSEYTGNDFSTSALQAEYNRFYSQCLSLNLEMKDPE